VTIDDHYILPLTVGSATQDIESAYLDLHDLMLREEDGEDCAEDILAVRENISRMLLSQSTHTAA